jgi:hypothetical protein
VSSGDSQKQESPYRSLLVTGAGGYVGRLLIEALARDRRRVERIVATDIRLPPEPERLPGVEYVVADVREPGLGTLLRDRGSDLVVHLAAIVTPGADTSRALEYAVDVTGTENVLAGCLEAGVRKLIYTSSGAAYGYHADNPEWIDENDALRGNPEFAYSDHKRLVEEMLARRAPSSARARATRSPRSSTGPSCSACAARRRPSSSSGTRTSWARSCAASTREAPASSISRGTARSGSRRWPAASASPSSRPRWGW